MVATPDIAIVSIVSRQVAEAIMQDDRMALAKDRVVRVLRYSSVEPAKLNA